MINRKALKGFDDVINWKAMSDEHGPSQSSNENRSPAEIPDELKNVQIGNVPGEKVNTFLSPLLGDFPAKMPPKLKFGTPENEELISGMIGGFSGNPGMKIAGAIGAPGFQAIEKGAEYLKEAAKKGYEYLRPSVAAEKLRETLGSGTTTENIAELGKRVKYGKESAKQEALIPKKELFSREGKSDVLSVKKESLPEGNVEKIAEMAEPGIKMSEYQGKAITKALKEYREKPKFNDTGRQINDAGNINAYIEKLEDIFGLEELPKKAIEPLEDALLIPTKRESAYLTDKEAALYYGKSGKLNDLHNAYQKKPTLINYDKLQSAIKKEIRKLSERDKKGTLGDIGEAKLNQFKLNASHLEKDASSFVETLPEKMQNLEKEWRTKYAQGVGKYENAPKVIRKLAEGKWSEVSGSQIASVFTRPTKEVKEILKDLGPSAVNNILYNALQKVGIGDAEGIANTILDLHRTKGYDKLMSPELIDQANKLLSQIHHANLIKKSLMAVGGAATGGLAFGPMGMMAGATLPFAKKGAKYIAEKIAK